MTCRTVHHHLQQLPVLQAQLELALEPVPEALGRLEPEAGRRVRVDRKRAGPLRMKERRERRMQVGPLVLVRPCPEQEVLRKLVAPLVLRVRRRRRVEQHQIRWQAWAVAEFRLLGPAAVLFSLESADPNDFQSQLLFQRNLLAVVERWKFVPSLAEPVHLELVAAASSPGWERPSASLELPQREPLAAHLVVGLPTSCAPGSSSRIDR